MPSRKQVLPDPFGPVATFTPPVSSGTGSGRSDPQPTSCTSSIRGTPLPALHEARILEAAILRGARRLQLGGAAGEVGEALVAREQGAGALGGAVVLQGVQQRAGAQDALVADEEAGALQPPDG